MKFKDFVKEVKHQSMPYYNALKKETQEKWKQEHMQYNKQEQIKTVGRAKRAAAMKAVQAENVAAKAISVSTAKTLSTTIASIPAHTPKKKEFVDKIGCISYKERQGFIKAANDLNVSQQQLLHMAVKAIANGEIKFKKEIKLAGH